MHAKLTHILTHTHTHTLSLSLSFTIHTHTHTSPITYHPCTQQFDAQTPWGYGNDGLLDVRLVTSSNGINLTYVPGRNGRSPYVPLGINRCGSRASSPSISEGWCSPQSGIEARINPDTSQIYMADGYVASNDGERVLLLHGCAAHCSSTLAI